MSGINYLSVVVAALAALVASTMRYIVFAKQWRKLSAANSTMGSARRPEPLKMLGEIVRNVVLALVLAYFVVQLGIVNWMGALQLGFLLWIGFPVILFTGSIMRENYPWKLAAIHTGDWLVKLVLISVIVSLWH
jgi:Protein of unknown function (DUF1761)